MTRNLQDIQDKYLNDVSYVKDLLKIMHDSFNGVFCDRCG